MRKIGARSVGRIFRGARILAVVMTLGTALAAVAENPAQAQDQAQALARLRQDLSRIPEIGRAAFGPQSDAIQQALNIVLRDYFRPVAAEALTAAALDGARHPRDGQSWSDAARAGMMSGLDPYSAYLTAHQFEATQIRTQGRYGGIGAELGLDKDNGSVKIIAPLDGSPAAVVGLRPGDLIGAVDGVDVSGLTVWDVSERLRGEPGSVVTLRVTGPDGAAARTLSVTRDVIRVEPLTFRIDGTVAYLRISTFSRQVAAALDQAVTEIEQRSVGGLSGVVLDLRNNPGGLVDQAVAVANQFLSSGTIVTVRGRRADDTVNHAANRGDAFPGLPLIVLINGGSASSSEIVAGALQDQHRAVIMGSRSFGKGMVQRYVPLDAGGALSLTTAQYLRPSGAVVECFGIEPNIVIAAESARERASVASCALGTQPPEEVSQWRMEEICPDTARQAAKGDRSYACARDALQNGVIAGR